MVGHVGPTGERDRETRRGAGTEIESSVEEHESYTRLAASETSCLFLRDSIPRAP